MESRGVDSFVPKFPDKLKLCQALQWKLILRI